MKLASIAEMQPIIERCSIFNSQFSILNSQLKAAYDYQTRNADLSKAVSDSLHRSEAHDYAARYQQATGTGT